MSVDSSLAIDTENMGEKQLQLLAEYVAKQLGAFFPVGNIESDKQRIFELLPDVIQRLKPILKAVRCFDSKIFNYIHSLQYTTFLYLLANEHWRKDPKSPIFADRLFYLNRALNSIDLFYSIELPSVFCIGHGGLGTVLGNVVYGERLVVFHNVTIGRVGDMRPKIGKNVVIYTGAVVTGNTMIGDGSVVSAGTILHNVEVPADVIAASVNGQIIFKPRNRDYTDLYFEHEA
ncbi:MAG: hypothetical protein V4448_08355 [Pseudomonadota bacterium]